MAGKDSEDEPFAEWYTPNNARQLAAESLGTKDIVSAGNGLLERIRGGLITTAAASGSTVQGSDAPKIERSPGVVRQELWRLYDPNTSDFWQGDLVFSYRILNPNSYGPRRGHIQVVTRYFGVRLKPSDFDALFPRPAGAPKQPSPPVTAPTSPVSPAVAPIAPSRGAPRAAHWDDVIIEMCRRIYCGEFKPQRPADIENAMLDWGRDNNIEFSEAAARPRAAKIWKALMT